MFSQDSSKDYILSLVWEKRAAYLHELKEIGERRHIPNISWNTARFFVETLRDYPITHTLEIGPANWFSTMMLGLAAPNAAIISIEFSRHAFEELRNNLQTFIALADENVPQENEKNNWLSPEKSVILNRVILDRYSLLFWDAREILPAFLLGASELRCHHPESYLVNIPQGRFDCIFIDGAFRMTRDFFDLSYPLLLPGGVMIIDDVIKYRWKMGGFHEYLETQGVAYEIVQTDEDDGVMVIKKMIS